jgi:hypothetical protein
MVISFFFIFGTVLGFLVKLFWVYGSFVFGTVLGFLVNLFWVYGYFVFIFSTVLGFLVNLFWVYGYCIRVPGRLKSTVGVDFSVGACIYFTDFWWAFKTY